MVKIRLSLSKFNLDVIDINGKSFTDVTVIATGELLVIFFSVAVTEYENSSWPLKFEFGR